MVWIEHEDDVDNTCTFSSFTQGFLGSQAGAGQPGESRARTGPWNIPKS